MNQNMTHHNHHEPNGEDSIPMWVYLTGVSSMILTILCFGIMLIGML